MATNQSKPFKFTFAIVNIKTQDKCMELSFAESSYERAIAQLPSLVHPSFEARLSSVVEDVQIFNMVELIENSNLLDVQSGIICHQTNCIGVMGGGIALQIKDKWPKVYERYMAECEVFKTDPKRLLGHVQDILIDDGLVIANCYGQVFPGNGTMTDYNAWDVMLDKLKDLSNYFSLNLHFPWMIGCGLAGGDWNVMQSKIEKAFASPNFHIEIHRLPNFGNVK